MRCILMLMLTAAVIILAFGAEIAGWKLNSVAAGAILMVWKDSIVAYFEHRKQATTKQENGQ